MILVHVSRSATLAIWAGHVFFSLHSLHSYQAIKELFLLVHFYIKESKRFDYWFMNLSLSLSFSFSLSIYMLDYRLFMYM